MVKMEQSLLLSLMLTIQASGFFFQRPGLYLLFIGVFTWMPSRSAAFLPFPSVFSGDIQPVDPYVQQSDGSFDLECKMLTSYGYYNQLNSSHMFWDFPDEAHDYSNSYIINASAIGIRVENISISMSGWYICCIDETTVSGSSSHMLIQTEVQIGNPPDPVTEIRCVSDNWQDMTCDFCPESGPERLTRYALFYRINQAEMECINYMEKNKVMCGCRWLKTDTDNPHQSFKKSLVYYLKITARGPFGNYNRSISINTSDFSIVKPHPVLELTSSVTNSTSMFISWKPAVGMEAPDKYRQLNYYINYTSEYGDEQQYLTTGILRNVTLSGLRPYTSYDIQVRCKTLDSEPIPLYWSEWAAITSRTMADAPRVGPDAPVGSYRWYECSGFTPSQSTNDCIELQVFWQDIAMIDRNGPIKEHRVIFIPVHGSPHQPQLLPGGALSSNREKVYMNRDYTVTIEAVTEEESTGKKFFSPLTVINIKKYIRKIDVPSDIVAETTEPEDGIVFKWTGPSIADNFTHFQCTTSASDRTICETSPEVSIIGGTKREHTHQGYQPDQSFAMATNYDVFSSGLTEWIPICRYSELPGKPVFTLSNEAERSLTVTWDQLVCSPTTPEGVTINYYIKWTDGVTVPMNMSVSANLSSYKVVLTDLKPYTVYTVNMVAESRAGNGSQTTKPLRTKESAPGDSPQNVEVLNTGSSNITLSWDKPTEPNGINLIYIVTVIGGTSDKTIPAIGEPDLTATWVLIEDLDGYINYTLYVVAKNSAPGSSPVSESVIAETKIRAPGVITDVKTETKSKTTIQISWVPPVPPNGPITSYLISVSRQDNRVEERIVAPHLTMYNMGFTDCSSDTEVVSTSVFAITTNEKEEELRSPPSKPQENSICTLTNWKLIIILVSAGVLLMIIIVVFVICYYKYERRGMDIDAVSKPNTDDLMKNNGTFPSAQMPHRPDDEDQETDVLLTPIQRRNSGDQDSANGSESSDARPDVRDVQHSDLKKQALLSTSSNTSSEDSGYRQDIAANGIQNEEILSRVSQGHQTSGNSQSASGDDELHVIVDMPPNIIKPSNKDDPDYILTGVSFDFEHINFDSSPVPISISPNTDSNSPGTQVTTVVTIDEQADCDSGDSNRNNSGQRGMVLAVPNDNIASAENSVKNVLNDPVSLIKNPIGDNPSDQLDNNSFPVHHLQLSSSCDKTDSVSDYMKAKGLNSSVINSSGYAPTQEGNRFNKDIEGDSNLMTKASDPFASGPSDSGRSGMQDQGMLAKSNTLPTQKDNRFHKEVSGRSKLMTVASDPFASGSMSDMLSNGSVQSSVSNTQPVKQKNNNSDNREELELNAVKLQSEGPPDIINIGVINNMQSLPIDSDPESVNRPLIPTDSENSKGSSGVSDYIKQDVMASNNNSSEGGYATSALQGNNRPSLDSQPESMANSKGSSGVSEHSKGGSSGLSDYVKQALISDDDNSSGGGYAASALQGSNKPSIDSQPESMANSKGSSGVSDYVKQSLISDDDNSGGGYTTSALQGSEVDNERDNSPSLVINPLDNDSGPGLVIDPLDADSGEGNSSMSLPMPINSDCSSEPDYVRHGLVNSDSSSNTDNGHEDDSSSQAPLMGDEDNSNSPQARMVDNSSPSALVIDPKDLLTFKNPIFEDTSC